MALKICSEQMCLIETSIGHLRELVNIQNSQKREEKIYRLDKEWGQKPPTLKDIDLISIIPER